MAELCHLFSVDVVDLYDSLRRDVIIEALKDAICTCRSDWSDAFVEWLIELIMLSLESAYGKYGNTWYIQLDGVGTGHTLSVHVANITVYYVFSRTIYNDIYNQIEDFVRFVDDCTGEWSGSIDNFVMWITELNETLQSRYNLSLTYEIGESCNFCTFLDVNYKFIDGKLVTDIHSKPTDAHRYLHYKSCHPSHVFRGIVYSQALRYRRIINDNVTLLERLTDLAGYFYNSGYPAKLVDPIIRTVANSERVLTYNTKNTKNSERPFFVPFITEYGVGENEIKQYFNVKVNNALKERPVFSELNKPIIKTVFCNAPSIRTTLFNQKKIVMSTGNAGQGVSVRCTSEEEARSRKGAKCQTCPMMSNSNSFILNGISYSKCDGGNCKSNNIIYLATCTICNLGYIGKTTVPLRDRFSGHRRSMKIVSTLTEITDKEALAAHAVFDHHSQLTFNELFRLNIVKNNVKPSELLKTEQQFINKYKTIRPTGLNISNPIGIALLRVN